MTIEQRASILRLLDAHRDVEAVLDHGGIVTLRAPDWRVSIDLDGAFIRAADERGLTTAAPIHT